MKPRILIVEDEPGIADTLQYALRTDGFEPAWVRDRRGGAGAGRRAAAPALVILDVGLPDASGFEIFSRLRETSDVPVVFLTARSDEIDRVVGLELGADDYIAKPFSPRELVARVRSVLRRAAKRERGASRRAGRGRERPRSSSTRAACRCATTAALLELSRYEFGLLKTLAVAPGPRLHARRAARPRLGRRQRQHGPHRRRARQDAAREDEGDRAASSSRSAPCAAAATRWPRTCRRRPS